MLVYDNGFWLVFINLLAFILMLGLKFGKGFIKLLSGLRNLLSFIWLFYVFLMKLLYYTL